MPCVSIDFHSYDPDWHENSETKACHTNTHMSYIHTELLQHHRQMSN